MVTKLRDIVAGNFASLKNHHALWEIVAGDFAGLKNRHTLSIACSWLVKWTQASTTRGGVMIKFEPNFVAIGAVIFGGLIVAATLFYFINKKKVAVYKPVFDRIPSSGK
ncbi:hypothetical protein CFP56_032582 [Quercus suber]|uniref:Uncharacterized protein n=1 Tax=Quercus suber TaxID=58331 RepID=A0AAW0LUB0_QUESU